MGEVFPCHESQAVFIHLVDPGTVGVWSRVVWVRPGQVLYGLTPSVAPPYLCQRLARVGIGPSIYVISIGFLPAVGGRAHTLPAGKALGCFSKWNYKVRIMRKDPVLS